MIMIVQKAIGVTDPVVMCIHVLKEVQEKEAAVIGLLFRHNAPYESTSRRSFLLIKAFLSFTATFKKN